MSTQENPCPGCREGSHVHDGSTHLLDSGQRIKCAAGTHWLRCRQPIGGEVYDLACDVIGPASKPGFIEIQVYERGRGKSGITYTWTRRVPENRVREK